MAGKLGDLRADMFDVGDEGAVEALVGGGLWLVVAFDPLRDLVALSCSSCGLAARLDFARPKKLVPS